MGNLNAKGGGHRVLIFSQFVTMLQHIRNARFLLHLRTVWQRLYRNLLDL